jgi:hypothetical protein
MKENGRPAMIWNFGFAAFEFVSDFEFRISDLAAHKLLELEPRSLRPRAGLGPRPLK